LEAAEKKLDQVLADFLKTGPDPAAFERVKTQIRAADIYSRDDAEGLANRYGEALATSLTIKDVEDWPGILAAVTPEDVKAAAAKVLDAKRSVTGWLMKEDTAEAGQ
jgi:zinc protease